MLWLWAPWVRDVRASRPGPRPVSRAQLSCPLRAEGARAWDSAHSAASILQDDECHGPARIPQGMAALGARPGPGSSPREHHDQEWGFGAHLACDLPAPSPAKPGERGRVRRRLVGGSRLL